MEFKLTFLRIWMDVLYTTLKIFKSLLDVPILRHFIAFIANIVCNHTIRVLDYIDKNE